MCSSVRSLAFLRERRNGCSSCSTNRSKPRCRPGRHGGGRGQPSPIPGRLVPLRSRQAAHRRAPALAARPGSTVAIVGPTGAGKTTLVNLIMRFYDIDSGSITLSGSQDASDAVDTRRMTRDDLRSRTGMVLQETWLFAGTIRDNIMYGRPDATEEEMVAAASAAYVDRFVQHAPSRVRHGARRRRDQPQRWRATVGDHRPRVCLADPRLLILDEATSSVDTRTELLIQRAMSRLREDRTAFVIAHRLSTIRDADLILVMEDGAIVRAGQPRRAARRAGRLLAPLQRTVRRPRSTKRSW